MVIGQTQYPITVEEYLHLSEKGHFPEGNRVELIEGEIVQMAAMGNPHKGCLDYLTMKLVLSLKERAIVRVQNSIQLDPYNEPEPDLLLLKYQSHFYRKEDPKPEEVYLLIEVAETSLKHDRDIKIPLYARHGIPAVWLVNLNDPCVEVYRELSEQEYQQTLICYPGQTLAPLAFPEVELKVSDILG